jgi:glycolate oxidase FAD binding subunit
MFNLHSGMVMETVVQQFREQVMHASATRSALRIRGGGTKDWYGRMGAGEVLDTRSYSGIVDYDPTELVITARCGTPLSEITAALAQQRQILAFEPPSFGVAATIGGVLACGLSGPRRAAAGAVRDFTLGAVLMDGRGEVLHFGGQVMKNVAGYDVSRLLAGSMGCLGLILQVSLKVLPLPRMETTRCFAFDAAQAIRQLNQWGGLPLPISASAWSDGMLSVRLSGSQAGVAAAVQKIGGDPVPDTEMFWAELREQTHRFFSAQSGNLWRLSLPSAAPPLALPAGEMRQQLIEWGGAQRWWLADGTEDAAAIRVAAQQAGGHVTLFRRSTPAVASDIEVFHPLAPAVAQIHRRLKAAFDPSAIFNPGRMYRDL